MPDGSAVVDIDPDLDQRTAYEVFLHELAHVRLDYQAVPTAIMANLAPGTLAPDMDKIKSKPYQAKEGRMWEQSRRWDQWAEANQWRVIYPTGDVILDRLQALKMMPIYRKGE